MSKFDNMSSMLWGLLIFFVFLTVFVVVERIIPIPFLSNTIEIDGQIESVNLRSVSGLYPYSVADITIDGQTLSFYAREAHRFQVGDTISLDAHSSGDIWYIDEIAEVNDD